MVGGVSTSADDMSKLLQLLTSKTKREELNIDEERFQAMLFQKRIVFQAVSDIYSLQCPPFPFRQLRICFILVCLKISW